MIDRKILTKDLREIGLNSGNTVCVHSSLKKIGEVQGGPETVIDAILDVIGDEGTLLMPAFSYCFEGREGVQPFDLEKTPSETGYITEVFRKRSGTLRSNHPTHSVSAYGKKAKKFVKDHESVCAFGIGSPLHKTLAVHGKVLLIGVDFRACSMIHVGETLCELSYLDKLCFKHCGWTGRALVRTTSGEITTPEQKQIPGCSKSFHKLQPVLEEKGCIRHGKIGDAESMLCSGRDIVDAVKKVCAENPMFLLCSSEDCPACEVRHNS